MKSLSQRIELLKVIAHPVRIQILDELIKGIKCVSDFKILKKDYPESLPRPACCPITKKGVYPGERKR